MSTMASLGICFIDTTCIDKLESTVGRSVCVKIYHDIGGPSDVCIQILELYE
jgi:hypothetical protein